jgi:serine/threonine protein kinase
MNKTMFNYNPHQDNDNSENSSYYGDSQHGSPVQSQVLQGFGQIEQHEESIFEGQCYLKTKTDRYKEHWAVLAGNELYCYRQKGDKDHRVMHSMVGTFIKEMPGEFSQSENGNLYPVKIMLPPNKSRILYFKQEEQQNTWLDKLRKVVGYSNLFDFYNFEDNLGKGQFGLVKLASHKKTGKKVAIKTVHKKDMKPIEIYQQRREIDVLKMCQHPNIVSLIDLFDNSDFYYIVLEYMQGKDLFDYIQFRNFKIPEDRVKELAYQIGIAIKYIHSYGIVHRDLKLENVMMSDNTEASVPKLVDFGLAKMIGPNEKADEPFGTLGYVAPEVLRKEPYSFSCDVWSFGCIIYALLSGSLPFDHESQKETIRMTLENKLEFDLPCWTKISDMCKDLLTKLLMKDPKKRITLEAALKHPWFKGVNTNQIGLVTNKAASQQFKEKKLNLSSNMTPDKI